jgi:long-chain fatty acid transport protein
LAPPPADPEAGLTDQGYDDAWGVGVRVGWQGNISEKLTLGAAYSSKIYMDEFDDYDFLFAEQGDFDIPANWSVGLAYKVTPKSTATFDIQHIQYSDVKAIANTGPALTGAPFDVVNRGGLGADNGLGFGWNDMTIFKLGWLYEHNDKFTYRFGVSHGDQPIDDDEVLFNVLAPAVIETHLTAGFSYRPSGKDDQEFTFTYMHGVHNKVKGDPLPSFGGIVPEIEMYQHAFEFEYSWKF